MARTVKVWTTISSPLRDEIRLLTRELGFGGETECLREAIRRGVDSLRTRVIARRIQVRKTNGSIRSVHNLLSEEYEEMISKKTKLEEVTRRAWKQPS